MATAEQNKLEDHGISWHRSSFFYAFLFAILVLAAVLMYSLYRGYYPPARGKKSGGNTLRIDVTSPITSLDPTSTISAGSTYVFPLLYSVLAYPDKDGGLVPDLATQWTSDDGGREWKISLRSDARFHNGKPVDSSDVAQSIRLTAQRFIPELNRMITGIDTSRKNEVVIRLTKKDQFFFDKIASTDILPFSPQGARGEGVPIGCGPYRFQERTSDGGVILQAFDHFYRGTPHIDHVRFYYIHDSDTVWYRLLFDETDAAFGVSGENTRYSWKTMEGFQVVKLGTSQLYAIFFNHQHPLFKNKEIRRAITASLDRRHLIDRHLGLDTATPAPGFFSSGSLFQCQSLTPIPYDPSLLYHLLPHFSPIGEKGREQNGGGWEFELLVPEGRTDLLYTAREVQLAMYSAGIRVRIAVLTMTEIIADRLKTGKFESVLLGLRNSENNLENMWGGNPHGALNYWGYRNERLDDILEKLRHSGDPKAAVGLYRQADEILFEDQPASFLYDISVDNNIISNRVKNFSLRSAPAHYTILRELSVSSLADDGDNS